MEFKDILRFVTQHFRLLILGAILGGVLGLAVAYMSPAPYEATSKILISRTKSDKGSDFGYLTDAQLIQTYAYILKTRPILDIVEEKLDTRVNPDNVKVSQVPETLILQITVQDENPQKAAYLANAFADAMVIQSGQLQEEQYDLQEEGLSSQIAAVQSQIDELEASYDNQEITVNQSIMDDVDKQILAYRSEILSLQKEIATIKTPENFEQESYLIDKNTRLAEIQPLLTLYQEIRTNLELLGRPYQSSSGPEDTTLSRLKTTIDQYQQVNLTLVNSLESIRLARVQRAPTVVTIENALVPTGRTSLSFVLNPIIAGGAGLILAMLAGLVLQRKRVKITSQKGVLENLGLEMVSTVRSVSADKPITAADVEGNFDVDKKSFYELRAFLEYQRYRKPFKSLLITSFGSEAGKSTVASNLAANYALGGSSVVLMDANFSHADQHFRFNVKNDQGLTDLLFRNRGYDVKFLQTTKIQKLAVLPVGSYQMDSLQLIDPAKAKQVINAVEGDEHLVIIDGPSLTDLNTRLIAASVDRILIVMREGTYSMDGLEEILNDLKADREKILGVVMNEQVAAEEVARSEIDQRKSIFPINVSHWVNKAKNLFTRATTKKEEPPEHLRRMEITDPYVSPNENILKAFEKANRKAVKKTEAVDIVSDPINTELETGHSVDVDPGLSLKQARVQGAVEVIPDPPEESENREEFAEVIPDPPERTANEQQSIEVIPDPPKKIAGKKQKTKAPASEKSVSEHQKNNGKKPQKTSGADAAVFPPKPGTASKKIAEKTDVLQIPLEINETASQVRKSGTLKKNTRPNDAKNKGELVTDPAQKSARKSRIKKTTH